VVQKSVGVENRVRKIKMRLYVDDIRKPPNDQWELARTNTRAIGLLLSGHVEEISLDHDICFYDRPQKIIQITEETFMPIAWFIAMMGKKNAPKKIRLHSANPAGRRHMHGVFEDAGLLDRVSISPCSPIYYDDVMGDLNGE